MTLRTLLGSGLIVSGSLMVTVASFASATATGATPLSVMDMDAIRGGNPPSKTCVDSQANCTTTVCEADNDPCTTCQPSPLPSKLCRQGTPDNCNITGLTECADAQLGTCLAGVCIPNQPTNAVECGVHFDCR